MIYIRSKYPASWRRCSRIFWRPVFPISRAFEMLRYKSQLSFSNHWWSECMCNKRLDFYGCYIRMKGYFHQACCPPQEAKTSSSCPKTYRNSRTCSPLRCIGRCRWTFSRKIRRQSPVRFDIQTASWSTWRKWSLLWVLPNLACWSCCFDGF